MGTNSKVGSKPILESLEAAFLWSSDYQWGVSEMVGKIKNAEYRFYLVFIVSMCLCYTSELPVCTSQVRESAHTSNSDIFFWWGAIVLLQVLVKVSIHQCQGEVC